MAEEEFDCWAFPDSNFVLHYRTFDQIPWERLVGPGKTAVVITPTLMKELDNKGWEAGPSIKERARQRKRWLLDRNDGEALRPGAILVFRTRRHGIDLSAHDLDFRAGDDHMIAEVLSSKERHPNARHVLITADGFLSKIAAGYEVEAIRPPDELLAPIEDPGEKEKKRLADEFRRLQAKSPELSLRFSNRETVLRVDLATPPPRSDEEIQERLEHARSELDPKYRHVAPYVTEAADYLRKLEEYLREGYVNDPLTVELPIKIHNIGGAPAERLRVRLLFPSGLFVTSVYSHRTREPKPPREPVSELAQAAIDSLAPKPFFDYVKPNSEIEFGSEHTKASYEYAVLDHLQHFPLTLYANFDNRTKAKSFRIDYTATSASIPDPLTGSLHVRVERPSTPEDRETEGPPEDHPVSE